jgi:hypothetical protein
MLLSPIRGSVSTMMALLSVITNEQRAALQSATYLVSCLGMVVGFGISSAGFQKVLKEKLEVGLAGQETAAEPIAKVRINFIDWQGLAPSVEETVQESYICALHVVFYITFGEVVIAALSRRE